MAHKVYSLIVGAIKQGKLIEPFDRFDFKKTCPGLAEGTYKVFLNKHRKGNPNRDTELFEKLASGKFKVVRPFKYGFD